MNEHDYTDYFTAELINDEPIIFMGLTQRELMLAFSLGMVIGFVISLVLMFIFKNPLGLLMFIVCSVIIPWIFSKIVKNIRKNNPPGYISHLFSRMKDRVFNSAERGVQKYSLGRSGS